MNYSTVHNTNVVRQRHSSLSLGLKGRRKTVIYSLVKFLQQRVVHAPLHLRIDANDFSTKLISHRGFLRGVSRIAVFLALRVFRKKMLFLPLTTK